MLDNDLPWILWILVWVVLAWIIHLERNQSGRNQLERNQTERNDEIWYRLRDGDYVFDCL